MRVYRVKVCDGQCVQVLGQQAKLDLQFQLIQQLRTELHTNTIFYYYAIYLYLPDLQKNFFMPYLVFMCIHTSFIQYNTYLSKYSLCFDILSTYPSIHLDALTDKDETQKK